MNRKNRRLACIRLVLPVLLLGIAQWGYADGGLLRKDSTTANRFNQAAATVYTRARHAARYRDLSFEQLHAEFMPAPNVQASRDSARALLDAIDKSNAWIDQISGNAMVKMPFGIKKSIEGEDATEYQVGFSAVEFGANGGVARVFARIIMPQQDESGEKKQVFFSGNVTLSRVGGVISDGKLFMIGDEPVKTSDQWSMVLFGDDPSKGRKPADMTYFQFNCSGFTQLGINGEVVLSKDYYLPVNNSYEVLPADPSQRITAALRVTVPSWDDILVEHLRFLRPFALKEVKGYCFEIIDATLDFSDQRNTKEDEGSEDFQDYLDDILPEEEGDQETWRGLYIRQMKVALPSEFRPKGAKDNLTLECDYGIIDGAGFNTIVNKVNLLSLDEGSADSWPISIEKLQVLIEGGSITGGGLEGTIVLPIQDKSKIKKGSPEAIAFTGKIFSNGDYEITAAFGDTIVAPLWKAHLELDKSSVLELKVKDGEFKPVVRLNGTLKFRTSGEKEAPVGDDVPPKKEEKKEFLTCEGISFEELKLQTEKPYMSVEGMGVEGTLSIASFEAEYSIGFTTDKPKALMLAGVKEDVVTLKLEVDMKLMDGKIGGKTALEVYAIYNEDKEQWEYYDYRIDSIRVNADFGKASFAGSLTILRKDPVFGDGFAGSLQLRVNQFVVAASGIFGTQTNPTTKTLYRYWSADAMVAGLKLVSGPVIFTGFSGGVSYKMALSQNPSTRMPSGIAYVPDDNAFLRVRAGVLFDVATEKAMTATAGLEIVFNKNWGVNQVLISGTARILANSGKGDATAVSGKLKTGLKSTASDTKAPAGQDDAAIWGNLLITLDLTNDTYQGNMTAFVNFNNAVVGSQAGYKAGTATFVFNSQKWNINIGTIETPVQVNLNAGIVNATGSAYFMMGSNIAAGSSAAGFSLRHGMGITVEGGYDGGWVYARLGGGLQYDFYLVKREGMTCDGQPLGINGWYGSAKVNAWLYASAGVRFWGLDFNVLSANVLANMEVRGPKPLYFYGRVKGHYSVGYGWLSTSGDFDVEVKKGSYCSF